MIHISGIRRKKNWIVFLVEIFVRERKSRLFNLSLILVICIFGDCLFEDTELKMWKFPTSRASDRDTHTHTQRTNEAMEQTLNPQHVRYGKL